MNTFSKPVDGLSSAFSTALIQFQPASVDIWDSKYRLRDVDGIPLDQSMDDTFIRVAKALADVEADSDTRAFWYGRFLWALRNGAVPAGRIMANAGAQQTKKATSTVNCTVSGPISDCMTDILGRNQQAGLTLKAGCGIGYEFSTLRPSGSFVAGAGALTGGPLSFMDVFDKTCFAVSSAGGQRGRKWRRSMWATRMCWRLSKPSGKTGAYGSLICHC
nr:ribonucleotide reductase N-terminal alpha domain-containing protein [Aliamphritea spongicola]